MEEELSCKLRAPLLLVSKWILGDANLAFAAVLIKQDAEEILILRRTGGEIDLINMWQYRLFTFDVHPLFFPIITDFLIVKMGSVHDAAFLLLLESNMFHQILQREKNKPDGFKNFLFFVFIAFIVWVIFFYKY